LNLITLKDKSVMLNILFKAVSEDPDQVWEEELAGLWALSLSCIPGINSSKRTSICTAWYPEVLYAQRNKRWIPCKENYLFNQEALSLVFRGKFLDHFGRATQRGTCTPKRPTTSLK